MFPKSHIVLASSLLLLIALPGKNKKKTSILGICGY